MSSIKSVFEKVNSRKMKVFLLFLLCSFLAWSVSKLSVDYESKTNFEIEYVNIPDSLLSMKSSKKRIAAKIEASGFQFLNYALNPKMIRLNLQNVLEEEGTYFLTANTVKNQMENQLPNSVSLLELSEPIHYTDLYVVASKYVPVIPKLNLRLSQNHVLSEKLMTQPDCVLIKGPEKVIGSIDNISTFPEDLSDISNDFSRKLRLQPIDSLGTVVMDVNEVMVSGKVVRFSEKEFDVTVTARNLPDGYRLKMFPDHVQLLCKAGIDRLKILKPEDFDVFVDFSSVVDGKYLIVQIYQEPQDVFSVRLLQNRVEFVLEKL